MPEINLPSCLSQEADTQPAEAVFRACAKRTALRAGRLLSARPEKQRSIRKRGAGFGSAETKSLFSTKLHNRVAACEGRNLVAGLRRRRLRPAGSDEPGIQQKPTNTARRIQRAEHTARTNAPSGQCESRICHKRKAARSGQRRVCEETEPFGPPQRQRPKKAETQKQKKNGSYDPFFQVVPPGFEPGTQGFSVLKPRFSAISVFFAKHQ